MKGFFFLALVLILVSCNGSDSGKASSAAQIPNNDSNNHSGSDEVVAKSEAAEFIKSSNTEIPNSLKIQQEDISEWKNENLITEEEANELLGSIE